MNELQKKYLRKTRDGDICLSMWAHFAEQTNPGKIDKLWTSCGSPFLLTLGEKGSRAHRRFSALGIDERMAIWAKVKETKDHQVAMRSKASYQVQMAADDVTTDIASISAMKHKLLERDSKVITPNKKPHMDAATPASRHHLLKQEQYHPSNNEESDAAYTNSPSTTIAITTTSSSAASTVTFFDPTKDPLSSVFLGGIDIGPPFSRLQLESAEVVNDLSKNMNLQLFPLFLAANFIWHAGHDLPGLSDESRATVQETLNIPLQQMPKELVTFCYDLDQEMATTGWIKSRATETREQNDLLILFQQVCKKLPTKYVSAGLHKNEDSHAHSTFDALMTSVFPGNHRHFELHWANRYQLTLYQLSFHDGIYPIFHGTIMTAVVPSDACSSFTLSRISWKM
ncbi:hypothetical protein BGZ70_002383 [Mortierella alpina]|uniref:Uncharacterized protein n=1 Tax=Mortierella alpina TaxID=64518 RepID=A0A9P6IU94_MORAP|nr:hypothetical protein BGZ70_002383 [Mortierella alpina]